MSAEKILEIDEQLAIHNTKARGGTLNGQNLRGLNSEQLAVYTIFATRAEDIYRHNKTKLAPIREMMIGGPGMGKTFTTTLIEEKYELECRRAQAKMSSMISAPMAVAAQLYATGSTIHTTYGITSDGQLLDLKGTARGAETNERCVHNKLTIIDEISAMTADLLKSLNKRVQLERQSNALYGGIDAMLIIGDFRQLPPGVGKGILPSLLRPKDDVERSLRGFHRTVLCQQERGRLDEWQVELVGKYTNTTNTFYPLSDPSLLRSNCEHCDAAKQPTRQCRHYHVLSKEDIQRDPRWIDASIININHDAANAVGNAKTQIYAVFKGKPVLKWLLPSLTQKGKNFEVMESLDPAQAHHYNELWGTYVEGLPVRITHNASLEARVVNGTGSCTLIGIRPRDPEALRRLLDTLDWVPGEVIIIPAPICVTICCPSAMEPFNSSITFMTDDSHGQRRSKKVKLGKLCHDTRAVNVTVIGSGYEPAFSGTTYAFQGQTMSMAIADFNVHQGVKLTLNHVNVAGSRVTDSLNFRVMPWTVGTGKDHLHCLRYDDDYLQWVSAYDDHGMFQEKLVVPVLDHGPPKPVRPTRPLPSTKISS